MSGKNKIIVYEVIDKQIRILINCNMRIVSEAPETSAVGRYSE